MDVLPASLLTNLSLQLGQFPSGLEDAVEAINNPINGFAWGWPTVILIAGTGILLMVGLGFMPLLRIPYGVRMLLRNPTSSSEGEISPFQALMTSMAATIGTGNIAGVAVAIAMGGPGAVFWMWLIAIFGIATKYAEALLAVHFREVDPLGNHVGGPMYYIRNGLGPNWAWLGGFFALFGMLAGFGIGNGVQSFEVSSALATIGIPRLLTGVVLGVLVFGVIIGGIKRIAQAASAIVPLMSLFYVIACLVIILSNISEVPAAFSTIFSNAFTGEAAASGTLTQVILMGFKRGIFSNEAGLGSAPIAHAAANTNDPVRQGTIAMLGTFIDTLVICTMTALVIITTGAYQSGESGSDLSIAAFNSGLAGSGWVVTAGLVVFALTTVLGWGFYSERCTEYLFGVQAILPFRLVWVAVVVIGAVAGNRGVVWDVADTLNGLMAIPNLIALVLLSGTVFRLSKNYQFEEG
ncbi:MULTISPECIES: alanine/glycine:cation symporter family protein [Prochlorococcus]|uniref:alanine/glycine:cation symporter family protein n=1 Tax=Prochlorococcus TaxID=1218 RepID=UPI0007BBF4BB|nr:MULTISPECIES: sodium:alanine symporter family protein [Prochlorococcus]KZR67774.1 Amino-acid carrier protein AlsT [Prochlorococcus marinus str. MIT 1312]KZR81629.1 Amino-acid carrier protein AlsT [Prochlorococcus marinus str. MIT 1327]